MALAGSELDAGLLASGGRAGAPVSRKAAPGPGNNSQLVASIGNLGIQFNFSCLGIAVAFMTASGGTVIPSDNTDPPLVADYPEPHWATFVIMGVVFAGAAVGMVLMGWIGDVVGRRAGMLLTLSLVVAGALASALATWGEPPLLYGILAFSRFVLGVGVGGIYPMAAATAHEGAAAGEHAETKVGWAFWWQSLGALLPYVVAILLLQLPRHAWTTSVQFRLILGLGAAVAAVPLHAAWRAGRTRGHLRPNKRSAEDEEHAHTMSAELSAHLHAAELEASQHATTVVEWDPSIEVAAVEAEREASANMGAHWRALIGTGGTWACYDVLYYACNIFTPSILASIFGSGESLTALCWQSIVVASLGLPGAASGIVLLKPRGGRWLSIWGFWLLAACCAAMGAVYQASPEGSAQVKFALFCLLTFALNTGPNISTYVLPASVFPTSVRGTFHGLSAACGKLGAVAGTFMFPPIKDAWGMAGVLWIQAALAVAGALISIFFLPKPPAARGTKGHLSVQ